MAADHMNRTATVLAGMRIATRCIAACTVRFEQTGQGSSGRGRGENVWYVNASNVGGNSTIIGISGIESKPLGSG